jgi:hypothetical protein
MCRNSNKHTTKSRETIPLNNGCCRSGFIKHASVLKGILAGVQYIKSYIKGIVLRDLHICFLVLIGTSHVAPLERVHLLLKFRFHVEFFDFHVSSKVVYSVSGAGLLDFSKLLSYPCTRILLRGSCKC